jgi:hypothetical protein
MDNFSGFSAGTDDQEREQLFERHGRLGLDPHAIVH